MRARHICARDIAGDQRELNMRTLLVIIAVILILIIGAYALRVYTVPPRPPPKRPCKTAADCPLGSSCLNGDCVAGGCSDATNDCPAGQKCVNGACVGGGCTTNAQCPSGQICRDPGINGECVGGCRSAGDCPSGESCVGGVCLPPGCRQDSQCPRGQKCRRGSCVTAGCTADSQCPNGQICKSGSCEGGGCTQNSQCPAGQTCRNPGPHGRCAGGCQSIGDCPSGHKCLGGKCVSPDVCVVDFNCPKGEKCLKGECVNSDVCNTTADCPPGKSCWRRKCTPPPKCASVPAPTLGKGIILRNRGVDPRYATGTTMASVVYIMYPYTTSEYQGMVLKAGPSAGQYYIQSFGGRQSPSFYVVRDTTNKTLVAKYVGSGYDPSKDPNAAWVYAGGVLSDPGKTVTLGAKACVGGSQPKACSGYQGPAAGPYLTTYDPYACQESEYIWDFTPIP
jgi:Cys-rich repeat protein